MNLNLIYYQEIKTFDAPLKILQKIAELIKKIKS